MKPAVADACLICAEHLLASGKKAEAIALYKSLGSNQPKQVLMAATRGLSDRGPQELRDPIVKRILVLLWGMFSLAVVLGLGSRLWAAEEPSRQARADDRRPGNGQGSRHAEHGTSADPRRSQGAGGHAAIRESAGEVARECQAGLLDALGDRGDRTARPAVLAMLKSPDEQVRAAAARGLARWARRPTWRSWRTPWPLPVRNGPPEPVSPASRGPEINTAIVGELKRAKPDVRAGLLAVLAVRGTRQSLPVVLQAAEDGNARVRTAALAAGMPRVGRSGPGRRHRQPAQGGEGGCGAVESRTGPAGRLRPRPRGLHRSNFRAGMADAGPSAAAALLRALARCGGDKALAAVVSATKDRRPAVSSEAVRLLANWPEPSAVAPLLAIARQAGPVGRNAVAVQGLIRLASPLKDRPADLTLLAKAIALPSVPKRSGWCWASCTTLPRPSLSRILAPGMDDPVLADDACLAAVAIAEKLPAQFKLAAPSRRRPARKPRIPRFEQGPRKRWTRSARREQWETPVHRDPTPLVGAVKQAGQLAVQPAVRS